jgi:hypothetical protein
MMKPAFSKLYSHWSRRLLLFVCRRLRRLGAREGLRGAGAPMAEALMEDAPPTEADTPTPKGPASKGAGILMEALAAAVAFRPLAWIVGARTAEE